MRINYKEKKILEEKEMDQKEVEYAVKETSLDLDSAILSAERELTSKKGKLETLNKPKRWALYCNNEFVCSYSSHKSAKAALHRKCEDMKKYPYDYDDEFYTIKPYNYDYRR